MVSPCSIRFKAIGRKLAECLVTPLIFLTWPIFGLWPHLNESLQLRNGGSVTQTNYIYWILSAKGFRGRWVLAPKKFPVEHLRVQSISPKKWLISRLISNATHKTFPGTQKLSLCHRGFWALPSSIITRSLKTIFNAHNCSRGCSLHWFSLPQHEQR